MNDTLTKPKVRNGKHAISRQRPEGILTRIQSRVEREIEARNCGDHESHSNFSSHENVNIPFPDPK
jgi:hypothetical protein